MDNCSVFDYPESIPLPFGNKIPIPYPKVYSLGVTVHEGSSPPPRLVMETSLKPGQLEPPS